MAWTGQYSGDEPVRVNKWLAQSGVCSRREAEGLIAGGLVQIDGEVVTDAGRKILPGQTLVLSDDATRRLDSAMTVLLNKPMGYVSGQPEPGKIPAARLLTAAAQLGDGPLPSSRDSLPPVGRLDEDSRGLLILSTDGVVAKAVIGPDAD
uniref:S4 domain-containing protein n=1 Tax=Brevundimonas sp. TaxID=1871086 RepID=UPI00351816D5